MYTYSTSKLLPQTAFINKLVQLIPCMQKENNDNSCMTINFCKHTHHTNIVPILTAQCYEVGIIFFQHLFKMQCINIYVHVSLSVKR